LNGWSRHHEKNDEIRKKEERTWLRHAGDTSLSNKDLEAKAKAQARKDSNRYLNIINQHDDAQTYSIRPEDF
jgi:hypothetical protein